MKLFHMFVKSSCEIKGWEGLVTLTSCFKPNFSCAFWPFLIVFDDSINYWPFTSSTSMLARGVEKELISKKMRVRLCTKGGMLRLACSKKIMFFWDLWHYPYLYDCFGCWVITIELIQKWGFKWSRIVLMVTCLSVTKKFWRVSLSSRRWHVLSLNNWETSHFHCRLCAHASLQTRI